MLYPVRITNIITLTSLVSVYTVCCYVTPAREAGFNVFVDPKGMLVVIEPHDAADVPYTYKVAVRASIWWAVSKAWRRRAATKKRG